MANQSGLEPAQEHPAMEDPIAALANEEPHPSLFAGTLDPEEDEPEADASGGSQPRESLPETGDAAQGDGANASDGGADPLQGGNEAEPTGEEKPEPEPFAVLKHNGETYPVKSMEELIALAQKGMDYTKKTQHLSGWIEAIQYIQRDPDFLNCLQLRMSGQPAALPYGVAAGATSPGTGEDTPPQGEDESYEDYTRRLAVHEGRRAAEEAMAAKALETTKADLIREIHSDPMGQVVMERIFEASTVPAAEGGIPPAVLRMANHDPDVCRFLFVNAKALHMAQQARVSAGGAAQSAPARKPPQAPPKAPYVEPPRRSLSGKAAALDNQVWTEEMADTMSAKEFEQFQQRVISGALSS